MNTNEKMQKLSFLKNLMMENGFHETESMEPTICQVLKDIFGSGNEYTKKASKIYNGSIVMPSSVSVLYHSAPKSELYKEKFEAYMKLLKQAEAYISFDGYGKVPLEIEFNNIQKSNIPCIFLSYCWDDTDKANIIDTQLSEKRIKVIRDVRGVDTWQSLSDFMQTIRDTDYAILLISDAYLKSVNCMYEIIEVMKERKYRLQIFPVIIDTEIYSLEKQMDYVRYWEDRVSILKGNLTTLEYTNGLALGHELKKTEDISRSIAEFLRTISDMKNPKLDDVVGEVLKKVI